METLRRGNYIIVRKENNEHGFDLHGKKQIEDCIKLIGKTVFDIVVTNPGNWLDNNTLQFKND